MVSGMWNWTHAVLLATAAVGSAFGAESNLADARATLQKWVETRQLIGTTKADWAADKEMLGQTRELFQRELQSIHEQRAKLSTNSTQADKERAAAEASLQAANESLAAASQFADAFEKQLHALAPRLPAPLQDIVQPLFSKLPQNPAQTRMTAAERVQVIVSVLNEIDKFNNAVTIFSERRQNKAGEEVAVETVYVGLGAAYFVNSSGEVAGVGSPGPSGWEWTLKPELASSIQEVIRIYRNERSARFVALPATIR